MSSVKSGDMDGHRVTFSLSGSGTDETVDHKLGRIPVEAFVTLRTSTGRIYRGAAAWTTTQIFLRASASVAGTLFLF